MFRTDIDYSEKIKTLLKAEDAILTEIYNVQQKIRESVNERNWDNLQNYLDLFDALSNKFASFETERIECFNYLGLKDSSSFSSLNKKLSQSVSLDIKDLYVSVKQKLLASKIENNALNDYIKITSEFLQGVFDNVIPQRKNTVYSRTGSIVKNQPKSMILNTVL